MCSNVPLDVSGGPFEGSGVPVCGLNDPLEVFSWFYNSLGCSRVHLGGSSNL